MSEWLVLSLAMAAACAVVLSIAFFNHRRIGEDDDPNETPDVIEYMTMMIGVIYAIVLGLAIGVQFPTGLVATQNAVPPETVGLATALTAFSRLLGGAVGVAVLTSVLIALLRQAAPEAQRRRERARDHRELAQQHGRVAVEQLQRPQA